MATSSTTRRGNGAGYGGAATGVESNSKARKPGPGRPTKEAAEVIAMAKAERIAVLKDNLIALALESERDSDRIAATLGFLKHEDAPATRLAGHDGGPIKTENRVIIEIVDPQPDGAESV